MGFQPMVHVLVHFGGTPKQQSREREAYSGPSLARLLYAFGVCVSTRTMGWKPMLRLGAFTCRGVRYQRLGVVLVGFFGRVQARGGTAVLVGVFAQGRVAQRRHD